MRAYDPRCILLCVSIDVLIHCKPLCCNPFLGPRTKYKIIIIIIIKNNSSEKRMPERPENGQKLVEEVQKYKDWNLTVYRWPVRALLIKKILFEEAMYKSDVYGLN